MPEKSTKRLAILFGVLCAAAIGMLISFARSAAVESAPAYSTLSTEPDGAKLLYDGLRGTGLTAISRQFRSVSIEKPRHSTVLFLGISPSTLNWAEASFFDELEQSAIAGNRIAITIINGEVFTFLDTGKAQRELKKRWGVEFKASADQSKSIINVDHTWTALPAYGPSVWRRDFGAGNIVLIADAGRLTNEGVAKNETNRRLLREVVADLPSVIFEEAHLGISESGSIAGLARHYRLQGLVGGLLLLAALFIWARSVSFPPAPPPADKTLLGADTRSMLTELMSRHLKGNLIATCVAEWNRTRAHAPALQLPTETNPVAAYSQLQESFDKKTKFTL